MKRGRGLLTGLGLVLMMALPVAAQQLPSVSMEVIEHPRQYLAQAYPASSLPLAGMADDRCFEGLRQGEQNGRAVPGVLCLDATVVAGLPRLNVNSFVTCPVGARSTVQSYRLEKRVPGSAKCPMTFTPRTYYQFGTGIRTWWALQFTQPGTVFTLDVTVRCLDARLRKTTLHIDRWIWEVIATLESLEQVIHLLHTDAVGTTEVPCIVGEEIYTALLVGLQEMRDARSRSRESFQDAFFRVEGLVAGSAVFGEVVEMDLWFPAGPPGNRAPVTPFGRVGILETLENPCACKLLVDLEYLGARLGVST